MTPRSRDPSSAHDRQVTPTFVTVDLQDHRVARVALNINLGLGTWRPAWPFLTGLDAGLFAGWRSRAVDLIRRLSAESLVGSMRIIPIDGASHFSFEFSLPFGDRDPSQNLFQSPLEAFHHGDATSLADSSETRQDVPGFAPDALEVLTLELGALVDDQVFGPYLFSVHDTIHCRSDLLRRRSALEHGERDRAS